MTVLRRLYDEQGQSPWLNLTRAYPRDGTLVGYVLDGIRGVTANPTHWGAHVTDTEYRAGEQ